MDASLLLYRDATAAPISGGITAHKDSGSTVIANSSLTPGGYGWNTDGSHTYSIQGQVIRGDGTVVQSSVSGSLKAWNTNALSDSASVQTTAGQSLVEQSDSIGAIRKSISSQTQGQAHNPERAVFSRNSYPYSMVSSYKQDATTFDMTAEVNITYHRYNLYSSPSSGGDASDSAVGDYSITWSNSMMSNAAYNRTLDHTTVYVESDTAAARYHVSDGVHGCYQRVAEAADGYVLSDTQEGKCTLPAGKYICGYELCSRGGGSSTVGTVAPAAVEMTKLQYPKSAAAVSLNKASSSVPLVRHPLMGRKKLTALMRANV